MSAGAMPVDEVIRVVVRSRAARLAGRAGPRALDRADAEQEMLLALARRWPSYDPARGSPAAFACVVTGRAAADLARRAGAKKRTPAGLVSLEALPEEAVCGPCRPWQRTGAEARRDLELDLGAAVARLPLDLRELAGALREEGTPAGAARRLGLSRAGTLAALRRLRARFERAGLGDYLESASSSCARFA